MQLHSCGDTVVHRKDEMLLLDAGCEFHMYASDITRTFPVSGKFSAAQKVVYETVLNVQQQCIDVSPWLMP